MLGYVVLLLVILLAGVIIGSFFYSKELKDRYIREIKKLIKSIKNEEYDESVPEYIKKEYEEIISVLLEKEKTMKRSLSELESYKQELNMTYKSLLAKSTELEIINNLLEKKVANLSNLNAVGRSVLSELDLEKIISIILDAFFVLTGAKKISLFLWEEGALVNKASKGNIQYKKESYVNYENIRGAKNSQYEKDYIEMAARVRDDDEGVIVTELKVKGKELGAIFIIEDLKDGKIKEDEMETISALALHVAIAINNAKMYGELVEKERIQKEIAIAAEIQKNLLPKDIKAAFGLEIANYFEPAREVGGDYYDYFISAEGKLSVAIGDVSGKGVPAAILMTLIRAVLKTLSFYGNLPDIMLTRLNEIVYEDVNEEMFLTLFYSTYSYETRTLYYSNAGHNPLIYYDSKNDEIKEENVKGVAIGFMEYYKYKLGQLKFNKNDVMVYYTDGVTEAENIKKEMFGIEKLKNVVYENRNMSAETIKNEILKELFKFRGNYEQVDDITLVVIKNKR